MKYALRGITAEELTYTMNRVKMDRNTKFEIKPQFSRTIRKVQENDKLYFVSLDVKVESTEEEPKPFNLKVKLVGIFEAEVYYGDNSMPDFGMITEFLCQKCLDKVAEMYEDEECKEILDRLYEDNLTKLIKPLTETKCKDCGGEVKDGKCTSCNELVEAHRTGDFVKLVNDKFRTDQPVSVYDLKCLMKSCDVTVKQQGLSKINLIIDFDNNCEIIQETEKAYLVSVPCYFRNPKDRSQILDTPNYIAV